MAWRQPSPNQSFPIRLSNRPSHDFSAFLGDDPSGIATYSQAGAQFGYAVSWTLLLTYPLMVAIQIISARIGQTSGRGLAGNIVLRYPPWIVLCTTIPFLIANIINVGADLGAMGDAVRLLIGGSALLYVVIFSGICVALQVELKYKRCVSVLKGADNLKEAPPFSTIQKSRVKI